jgi:N-acetyl-gamma-glutamylphosphate reductase
MSVSGVSAGGANASSQAAQPLTLTPHKHTRHQAQSISDVDGQSSSLANTPSAASPTGRKVNILA